ncbi:hypothetical protein D3C85_1370340 [compost metagenome]
MLLSCVQLRTAGQQLLLPGVQLLAACGNLPACSKQLLELLVLLQAGRCRHHLLQPLGHLIRTGGKLAAGRFRRGQSLLQLAASRLRGQQSLFQLCRAILRLHSTRLQLLFGCNQLA